MKQINSNEDKLLSHHQHLEHHHKELGHVHTSGDKLKFAFWITLIILFVEIIGGSLANSLALLSDAGHVLTDAAALGMAWYAAVQSKKKPTLKLTYGFHRTGILAALANSVTLILIAIIITYEAIHRIQHPEPVESTIMYVTAFIGLAVNVGIAFAFRGGENNLNVRSALLHVIGDAAASAGVIIGGIVMSLTKWYIIDPILSILIALLISWGAWGIIKETLHILMEGTPDDFNSEELVEFIHTLKGACDIHDLHIWSLTPEKVAFTCHLAVDPDLDLSQANALVSQTKEFLNEKFNINHATIEVETAKCPCTSLLCHHTLWDSPAEKDS